ncbi:MAG: GerMN domain-containing protein [Spirochaetaceae bacterium]|nr:GerMN domain-containing protein [Spirochaetaceae bacterium]
MSWLKENPEQKAERTVLALALLFLLFHGAGSVIGKASLYFANGKHSALAREQRNIELIGSVESRAEALVEEVILGPMEKGNSPLVPVLSRVQSVLHRGNKLYIDISVPDIADMTVPFPMVSSAIQKTIEKDIPLAGQVIVFVNGEAAVH